MPEEGQNMCQCGGSEVMEVAADFISRGTRDGRGRSAGGPAAGRRQGRLLGRRQNVEEAVACKGRAASVCRLLVLECHVQHFQSAELRLDIPIQTTCWPSRSALTAACILHSLSPMSCMMVVFAALDLPKASLADA
jgi:hypothetical protein